MINDMHPIVQILQINQATALAPDIAEFGRAKGKSHENEDRSLAFLVKAMESNIAKSTKIR